MMPKNILGQDVSSLDQIPPPNEFYEKVSKIFKEKLKMTEPAYSGYDELSEQEDDYVARHNAMHLADVIDLIISLDLSESAKRKKFLIFTTIRELQKMGKLK